MILLSSSEISSGFIKKFKKKKKKWGYTYYVINYEMRVKADTNCLIYPHVFAKANLNRV